MNDQLKQYLAYFQTKSEPLYAVLVTGAWGVGKTHQVLEALNEEERYYISLFGLESAKDVHALVLQEVDPKAAKRTKAIEEIGSVAKNTGGWLGIFSAAPALNQSFLSKEVRPSKTIVFDDLERSKLDLQNLIGVLNYYVEHLKCRVVVIAHDEELKGSFGQMKEKLFGQTIRVRPQIDQAFNDFVQNVVAYGSKSFVNQHKERIKSIFQNSGCQSLRVLRHVLEDLGRLHQELSLVHRRNSDAMLELVSLFSALSFAVRMNELSASDLQQRKDLTIRHLMQKDNSDESIEKHALISLAEKHKGLDLESMVLSDDCLVHMLCEGLFLKSEIRGALDNCHYFFEPEEEKPWKVLWNLDHMEDQEVEDAHKRLLKEFENREVTEIGDMLHIFGILLRLSDAGVLKVDLASTVSNCKKYIDDLLASNRLPAKSLSLLDEFDAHMGHDGFMYWFSDEPSFQEILEHLKASRGKALENQYPRIAAELLVLMTEDVDEFIENVSVTNNGDNLYSHVPVLEHIEPKDFVEAWLESPKANWNKIGLALKNRYRFPSSKNELKQEHAWVENVSNLMRAEASQAEGFAKMRIMRFIPDVPNS